MTINTNIEFFLDIPRDGVTTGAVIDATLDDFDVDDPESDFDSYSDDSSVDFDFDDDYSGESTTSHSITFFQSMVDRIGENGTLPQYRLEQFIERLVLEQDDLSQTSNLNDDDDSLELARRIRGPSRRRDIRDSCLGDSLNLTRTRVPIISDNTTDEEECSELGMADDDDDDDFQEYFMVLKDSPNDNSISIAFSTSCPTPFYHRSGVAKSQSL